jgi:hypothetical protein
MNPRPDEPKVVFAGDFGLCGESFEARYRQRPIDPWKPLRERFGAQAAIVANLECAITDRTAGRPCKWANLRMGDSLRPVLGDVAIMVLGNNHVGDFGVAGVQDTIDALTERGIPGVGFGLCITDALRPGILKMGDKRLGIVSLCCPTTNSEFLATYWEPGVAPCTMSTLGDAVRMAQHQCDAVVAYIHWGREHVHEPVPDQMRLARHAIDCGADAVVGCHSHTIQGYERYRGRWINYDFHPSEAQRRRPDGSLERIPITHSRSNRQSLAVAFRVRPNSGSGALELCAVQPFEFDDEFVPRPVSTADLTFDLARANTRLARYAARHRRRLDSRAEPRFVASWHNDAALAFRYGENSLRSPWLTRAVRIAKRALRPAARVLRAGFKSSSASKTVS